MEGIFDEIRQERKQQQIKFGEEEVGEYRIGTDDNNITIVLEKKPIWFHRTMMRLFFGWRWITYSQPPTKKRVHKNS